MKPFFHDPIAQLAHELSLSPLRHRIRQASGIARAIDLIDSEKEYPYSFICFTITGYRPRRTADSLLSGKELLGDLIQLLENLTEADPLPADGAIYDMESLARRFRVSTKTIGRWRSRGLAGCWYMVDAGRPRLAFSSRSVQRFIARNRELIARGASFQLMNPAEKARIIERARELVATEKCSLHLVTVRLSQETGRAIETIRYTLRRFDKENPDLALFDRAEQPQPIDADHVIYEAHLAGESVAALATRFSRTQNELRATLTRAAASQLVSQPISYIYNVAFDAPDAEQAILGAKAPASEATAEPVRIPDDLPAYLAELYRTPLLSKAQEADAFRRMNLILHQASNIQSRIAKDISNATTRDITALQERLAAAQEFKNKIIQANLRLVVSIAKRHLRSHAGDSLFELVSDGNVSLIKAVERFDYGKGFAFSTYASWAIMRGFARSIPEEQSQCERFRTGCDEFLAAARDIRSIELPVDDEASAARAKLVEGMRHLDTRERAVLQRRYGLDGQGEQATLEQVGRELSLSKERVRQIELSALAKLRSSLGGESAALLAG